MATYYIDNQNGRPENDGLTPETARDSEAGLCVLPGDTILFKRGCVFYEELHTVSGEEGRPVTYGAYGEGKMPTFSGAVDVSRECDWEPAGENRWRCTKNLETEACNLVFDGQTGATLRWEKEDLRAPGDFWDSCFGFAQQNLPCENHELLLFAPQNPAYCWKKIECVLRVHRALAQNGHDMVMENLQFENSGVHGIAGGAAKNFTVRGCRFAFLGGSVWSREKRIRFGNGVECWNGAENVTVTHCTFYEIYDSGFTHQGSRGICQPAKNMVCDENVFIKCGMAAYEQRDVLPQSCSFSRNICLDAGMGFSKNGETLPRRSEIWPQPMGHHVFLWRITEPTPDGKLLMRQNFFGNAPLGAAVYSIIDRRAEEQITMEENTYYMPQRVLYHRLFGTDFTDFAAYRAATGKDGHSAVL